MNLLYKKIFKRIWGIVLAVIAMPFLIIITIPVAVLIKLEDGGPVFYKGLRYGKKMKKFYEYKFRSMAIDAPDIRNADGSTYNSETDPRMTKVGTFIRKTSIDELPQIINILKGDMAWVGPRPSPMGNEATYTDYIKQKFNVRPGLTGYNQVMLRNLATPEERYDNDIYYEKNVSLTLDMKILFMTVKTVLTHKGINKVNSSNQENMDGDKTR